MSIYEQKPWLSLYDRDQPAEISLRPGQTATAEELIAFCREQMAAYKYPRQVEFLDELPKTVSGKLLRRELRDRA